MTKKILALLLIAVMSLTALIGCNEKAEQPENVETNVQDVVEDQVQEDAAQTAIDDETFASLQDIYADLVELYNIVANAINDGTFTADEETTALMTEAADIITEIGEIAIEDFASEQEAVDLANAMAQMAEGLGVVAEELAAQATGEEVETEAVIDEETFAQMQEIYGGVVEIYNLIAEAINDGTFTADEETTALMTDAAEIITEIGEIKIGDFASEQEAIDFIEAMGEMAEALGIIAESMAQ